MLAIVDQDQVCIEDIISRIHAGIHCGDGMRNIVLNTILRRIPKRVRNLTR